MVLKCFIFGIRNHCDNHNYHQSTSNLILVCLKTLKWLQTSPENHLFFVCSKTGVTQTSRKRHSREVWRREEVESHGFVWRGNSSVKSSHELLGSWKEKEPKKSTPLKRRKKSSERSTYHLFGFHVNFPRRMLVSLPLCENTWKQNRFYEKFNQILR